MNANGDWVFNVGNPQEITLSFLAKQIAKKTNPALPSTYHAKPQDDPQRRMPDITKITASTGWTPKVTLDDGLNQTISYFKHQLVNV
jgi:UDP-glucuronate decarboxylase